MAQSPSKPRARSKSQAEARFRELVDELKLLAVSFPHLRDSFDADELPISFIIKRDATRAQARRVKKSPAARSGR